mmetsp:Transcript_50150/g.121513  ORF Transcript_50150/g.121513 Transcript_50150/m.121513 type:complete len:335 (+) Transcript_50150:170-1174(+)|eukprot:CAMPEP_0113482288 /NCGR_PEP_ID=MMETSP0014_2-20120614/22841_1 /TAXON_ID=2857 /ORGANISM="Nitzschia sp." /LENGTH=334 /DNA_ID=CAMNT_0000375799 /DNA_START=63 /DNA_END=1067 /DNA_ORIENTATION=+ /assembly_acc=CAM_ASM_000159
MSTLVKKPLEDVGGLCHLVEAATALSELAMSSTKPSSSQNASVISDDDDQIRSVVRRHQSSSSSATTDTHNVKAANSSSSKKREIFPQKLHEILADSSLSDIITWLPHGRSFVIIRPDLFCEQVLPKYLPPVDSRGSTKYPSFTRKLNRWGFRQATRGADTGAFHHPFFCRDQPELCLQMVCQKSRDRQTAASSAGGTNNSTTPGGRRSLPPKKRVFGSGSGNGTSPSTATPSASKKQQPATTAVPSAKREAVQQHQPAARVVSSPSSAAPSPVVAAAATTASVGKTLPFVSTDKEFVKSILQQRDATEILRAAKSQLFDAYQKALKNEEEKKR